MTRLLAAAVTATLVGAGLAATVTAQPAYAMPTLPVVAAGGYHSCALMPDRTVWCWGQNTTGQVGDGIKTDSLAPVQVTGLPRRSTSRRASITHARSAPRAQRRCLVLGLQ
ncbi:MAG TPA: hypothetical protein VMA95_11790, partial [Streptosporangiaceae bacterium]|nr:hypothetical protein [Streptosporangiaceae bacterium]